MAAKSLLRQSVSDNEVHVLSRKKEMKKEHEYLKRRRIRTK
jgi:hypothetical protein